MSNRISVPLEPSIQHLRNSSFVHLVEFSPPPSINVRRTLHFRPLPATLFRTREYRVLDSLGPILTLRFGRLSCASVI